MPTQIYDAVIVGSGATGGWAAKELCEKGMKVLLLEAGRKLDPSKDFTEHVWPYELRYEGLRRSQELARQQPIQRRCYACDEYSGHFFVKDTENPYTTAEGKPFSWIRGRHVGGRTLMWGRQSYRLSNYDLKAASHDGFGMDWPISYEELAPYYDKVEEYIGVSGSYEKLPQLPDGKFLPPMNFTCGERLLKKAVDKMPGRRMTIGRVAMLTRDHNGRPKCHYCGHCERGCTTASYFSSPSSTIPAAMASRNLTLEPHSVVHKVLVDENGKPKGVEVVDELTGQTREAFGKVVILCASTLESTRIMLNSASRRHPNGLANNSGVLGHYLVDHIYDVTVMGILPNLAGKPKQWEDARNNGIYIPRYRNLGAREKDFIRGYGYQGGSGRGMFPAHARLMPGFGRDFKKIVRENWPMPVALYGFGEMLPRYENFVEIDKNRVDRWGIPVLRITCEHSDNERAMVRQIVADAQEMLQAAGAEIVQVNDKAAEPGLGIHELGTCRMGDDPQRSVLNKFNQAHDLKNLFVMDGGAFVSQGCQNPTLTMMALTVRACEYLVEEYKRGNL
ncbi:MAG: GMC family oxidoreductase [Acidobacteria bacterium]|nr:MAG: GMC family oxidoreductase [Acidobacteriota bacterium]